MNILNGVEFVVQQRVEVLRRLNPQMSVDWAIAENDWGFISVSKDGHVSGFEFIESWTSWAQQERLSQIEEASKAGIDTVMIVPSWFFLEAASRLAKAKMDVILLSYDENGIHPVPRPS